MNTHAIYKMAVRLFLGGALSVTLSSAVAVTPATTPLTTGSSAVLPNIMLMLDNSGSMEGNVPSGGTTTFKRISVSSPSNITSYLPSLGNFQCNSPVTGGTTAANATEINMRNNSGTPSFCTGAATSSASTPCSSSTKFSASRCFNNSQYYKIRVYAATTTKTSAASPLWEAFTGQQLNWYFNVANVAALEGNEQLQQVFANTANLTANASSTSSADVNLKRMMMLKTATRALLNDLKPAINATTNAEEKPKVRLGLSTFDGQCGSHSHDCNDGGALLQTISDLTRSKTDAILDYVGDTVISKTGTSVSYTGLLEPTAYTPLGETHADIGFYFSEGETNLTYPRMPYTDKNTSTTAYTTAQSVTRQALFNAGTVADDGKTLGIVNSYIVTTAFTGAAIGNIITENRVVDASSGNVITRWQNQTTLSTLTTNPDTDENLWDSLIELSSTVNISGIYRVKTAFSGASLNNLITYNPVTGKWRNESTWTTLSAAPTLSRLTLLDSKTYSLANLSDDDGKVDGLRLDAPAADINPLLPPIKDWCQKSYAIVVTDGEPTEDTRFGALVNSLKSSSTIKSYLATVAAVLYNMDFRPNLGVNPTQKAFLNNVSTYAINVGDATAATLDEVAKLGGTNVSYSASNVTELTAIFDRVIEEIQSKVGSFSAVVANTSKLDANSALFQASYDTADWTGDFVALKLNETTGIPDPTPVWQAGKLIPKCKGSTECSANTYRNIFTYNTTTDKGVPFKNTSASAICALLSTNQKNNLNTTGTGGACDTMAQWRLDWLRGDISHEKTNDQFGYVTSPASTDPRLTTAANDRVFRNRVRYWQDTSAAVAATTKTAAIPAHTLGEVRQDAWLLGDIVNSDAVYVSDENYGYSKLSGDEGSKYAQFVKDKASRTKVVYIGANDGMLHGFNAAISGANMGKESLAFMPESVFSRFKTLSDPAYSHQYSVDGSPRVGDAYFSSDSKWHTVLVGTTGAGGKGVFALDVSTPDTFSAGNVLWEISDSDTPNPANVATGSSLTDKADFAANMGYSLPQASIGKLHNGKWAAIVANGYASAGKKAVLYLIEIETGKIIKTLDTLTGGGSVDNGLSTPFATDVDADGVVDVIYAGDLLGNMWKFDVSADSAADWKVAYGTTSTPAPLFTACNDAVNCSTTRQAITNKPQVGRATDPAQAGKGIMVYFGTGKYFEDTDNDNKQIQSFYGIWDECPLVSSFTTANKHSCPTSVPKTNLQEQSILKELTPSGTTANVRLTSNTPVKYAPEPHSNACITAKTCRQGWYINFQNVNPTALDPKENGERIVSASLLRGGRIIFTTLIPQPVAKTGVDSCSPEANSSSWLMELNAISGSRLESTKPALDINGNGSVGLDDVVKGQLLNSDGTEADPPASGIKVENGSSKTPAIVGKDSATEIKFTGSSEAKTAGLVYETASKEDNSTQARLSWRQLP